MIFIPYNTRVIKNHNVVIWRRVLPAVIFHISIKILTTFICMTYWPVASTLLASLNCFTFVFWIVWLRHVLVCHLPVLHAFLLFSVHVCWSALYLLILTVVLSITTVSSKDRLIDCSSNFWAALLLIVIDWHKSSSLFLDCSNLFDEILGLGVPHWGVTLHYRSYHLPSILYMPYI